MNMPLQIKCTLYFQENSYTVETLDGIASKLGGSLEEIKTAVDYLSSVSILETIGEGENASYRYIQPSCIQMIQG